MARIFCIYFLDSLELISDQHLFVSYSYLSSDGAARHLLREGLQESALSAQGKRHHILLQGAAYTAEQTRSLDQILSQKNGDQEELEDL